MVQRYIFSDIWDDYENCGTKLCSKINYLIPNDELLNIRRIGLHKALMKFDINFGVDFDYFVFKGISHELCNEYNLYKGNLADYSIEENFMSENNNKLLGLFFENYQYIELDYDNLNLFNEIEKILEADEYDCLVKKLQRGIPIVKIENGQRLWKSIKNKIKVFLLEDEKDLNLCIDLM
jgi:DNA-directed RNA polymerase specialized sigma subunit